MAVRICHRQCKTEWVGWRKFFRGVGPTLNAENAFRMGHPRLAAGTPPAQPARRPALLMAGPFGRRIVEHVERPLEKPDLHRA